MSSKDENMLWASRFHSEKRKKLTVLDENVIAAPDSVLTASLLVSVEVLARGKQQRALGSPADQDEVR